MPGVRWTARDASPTGIDGVYPGHRSKRWRRHRTDVGSEESTVNLFAKTCNYDVMDAERIAARTFVGLGGVIWAVLAIGASLVYPSGSAPTVYLPALAVLVVAAIALSIGWFFENLAAILLFVAAVATVVWGIMAGWEAGVWGVMAIFLIGPEIIAGLLFLMAAQMQKVCELKMAAGS
jgi:hypothetical protein